MKKTFFGFLSLFSLICLGACSKNDSPRSKLTSFRNYSIESKLGDYKELKHLYNQEDNDWRKGFSVYNNLQDSLKLGDLRLDSIRYYFYDGLLAQIAIFSKTDRNHLERIKSAYEEIYGPFPNFEQSTECCYSSTAIDTLGIGFSIVYYDDPDSLVNSIEVFYSSDKLKEKAEADNKNVYLNDI